MDSSLTPTGHIDLLADKQGWLEYWNKKNQGGFLYALVAEFYRKVIIRPALNHFIRKYFTPGSTLLHAGCGSGQVDTDLDDSYRIIGLDYCSKAVEIYARTHRGRSKTVHASIFETPVPSHSIDGIYNLGVMEHFTKEEIQKCLVELKRILKTNGKLVLFWPPEFGLSVLFFKGVTKLAKLFLGKAVSFHPEEVSRLQSKAEAFAILTAGGFEVLEYSFGPRDLWTYCTVVSRPKP